MSKTLRNASSMTKKAGAVASLVALVLGASLAWGGEHDSVKHGEHRGQTAASPQHAGEPSEPHEGAEGHGEHEGLAPLNWLDIWDAKRPAVVALLINFGLLAGLYYALFRKPVADGLKKRRASVGKDIDDAQKMLAEAKARATKYQADLRNVASDAATAKSSLVAAGHGEAERLATEARERAARMERDAIRLVEQEQKQAQQDLLVETVDRTMASAHELLARSVTVDDHVRLADELLAELRRRPTAGAEQGQPIRGSL